jgi:hypothetical protein
MRVTSLVAGLLVMTLAGVGAASAQDGRPSEGAPKMAQWDADGTWEVLGVANADPASERPQWNGEAIAGWRLGVGRYWTTHVKSEFGVTLIPQSDSFDYERWPVPGAPDVPYVFTENTQQLTTFSGNLAYQFFENAFTHPYLSAGIRFDSLREHRFRNQEVQTVSRITYTVPALDQRAASVTARPFVALGSKFYFNERLFVRAELPITFGSRGVYSAGFHFGFGADF